MKDVERWLKNGLIDENLAQILNADLKKKLKKSKSSQHRLYYTQ